MDLSVIITAGGSSTRYGIKNKLLELIDGEEVILHSIRAFIPFMPKEIIITVSASFECEMKKIVSKIDFANIKLVKGGATRQESVFNGLKACENPDFVAIHDAARPLIRQEDIEKCLKKAIDTNAAIVAVKAVDTIKKVDDSGKIVETPNRNTLWAVQTPQIFDYRLILGAHQKLNGQSFSDDAGMLESLDLPVYVVEGSYSNIKITTKKDIYLANELIKEL